MLRGKDWQQSFYCNLYDKIPEDHVLKAVSKAVDFGFINDMLADSYCRNFGRPAKEPEMMAKLLILQRLYDLSDVRVIQEAQLNLAYMWFLRINPEDSLPDPSLLAKFRTQRLQESDVDAILTETVRQCVLKGIIRDTGLAIDTTHSHAGTTKKVPERIMKHLAKAIIQSLTKEKILSGEIDTTIPEYKDIADHREAKRVMREYLEKLIAQAKNVTDSNSKKTNQAIDKAEKILSDPKFIEQKGVRSLFDMDARVGHKSKNDNFFGYKAEFTMLPTERIITAINGYDGAYYDGSNAIELFERTKLAGLQVDAYYGDKAYFKKPILDYIKDNHAQAIIPVSGQSYQIDDNFFSYDKDSDQWVCPMGNRTTGKKIMRRSQGTTYYRMPFSKEQCISCPQREICAGTAKSKVLSLGVNTAEYYEYSQQAKKQAFIKKYKKRASQEWKNGELKRFHGMEKNKGSSRRSYIIQIKFTAIAVNLKRIAALLLRPASPAAAAAANLLSFLLALPNLHKIANVKG